MKYITKDSGKRSEYKSGMVRDLNVGKARFDLLIPKNVPYQEQLLTRFAQLMERGAAKYSARNWEKAEGQEELDRFKESALRHLMQWFCGEIDEDHAVAVLFNIMAYEATISKIKHNKELWRENAESTDLGLRFLRRKATGTPVLSVVKE
jgi:hypothetical protein